MHSSADVNRDGSGWHSTFYSRPAFIAAIRLLPLLPLQRVALQCLRRLLWLSRREPARKRRGIVSQLFEDARRIGIGVGDVGGNEVRVARLEVNVERDKAGVAAYLFGHIPEGMLSRSQVSHRPHEESKRVVLSVDLVHLQRPAA